MKKIILLTILYAVSTGCNSAVIKEKSKETGDLKGKQENIDSINMGWTSYSFGLYYKNSAKTEQDKDRKISLLKQAVEKFIDAARNGSSLDRIYFQLSESFYILRDYEKSIDYALKSISIDKHNPEAYSRLYYTYMTLRNYKSAAAIYEDYLKIFPDDIRVQYILAEHYYKRLLDYNQSIKAFQRVIEISRKTSVESFYLENAYYSIGYISYKNGDLASSIKNFKLVRDINSSNVNAAYMLALLFMENYDLVNAERSSDVFLSMNPGNHVMLTIKGRIRYLNGQPSAISYFKGAKKSNTIDGFLARGLYLHMIGRSGESEKYLRTVIKYKPNYISAHLALAEIEKGKKDTKSAFNEYITAGVFAYKKKLYNVARNCFNESLKFELQVPEVYFYLGRVYEEMGNTSMAILNYKKVNELKESLDMILHIGYLYGLKKETASSLKYFDRAIDMEPENSKPYFYKGLGFLRGNNYDSAEENLKKAIDLNQEKNKEKYYFYLAIVQEKQNKFTEAIESLETAIKHNPKSARAHNYLGYLFAEKNINIDRSFLLIKKALEIDPGNGAYLDSLGWVYFRMGDYKQAINKLLLAERELNMLNTPDPVVFDHLGDTYLKIGDVKKAVDYWEKSIGIKKDGKIEIKIKKIKGINP